MFRLILVIAIACVLSTSTLAGDNSAGGTVSKVHKEMGKITFELTIGDKKLTRSFSTDDLIVVDKDGKKHQGKAIFDVLKEMDPIWIPDLKGQKVLLNVLKKKA